MSKGKIFKADAFDPSQFTFSTVKINKYGGKGVYVNCDKHKIRIETPKMLCPWGMSGYPQENPESFNVTLQFPKEMSDRMQVFHDKMEGINERVVETAIERSQEWLGKKTLKQDMANEFYSPLLRFSTSTDKNGIAYPPSFALKLRQMNGNFTVKCYGPDKQPANVKDVVTKGCYIKAIMEINSIFLKKNQFSASGTALQIRVYPSSRPTGYTFLPDEDDDEVIVLGDLDEHTTPPTPTPPTQPEDDDTEDNSSESSSSDESNSDEDDTTIQEPQPKKTKFSKSKAKPKPKGKK